MSWRARLRGLLPYVIVAAAGFLIAYIVLFLVVFPGEVVPTELRVPDVMGLAYDEAAQKVDAAGYTPERGEQVYHPTAKPQVVIEQAPRGGQIQPAGTKVVLKVSLGGREATVPPVAGLSTRDAQLALENAGFDVGDVQFLASDLPRGQVVESSPAAGASARLPARVVLRASAGPSTISMPDVTGRTLAEARSALEQVGLRLAGTEVDSTAPGTPGTVARQAPDARRTVRAGSMVRLVLVP